MANTKLGKGKAARTSRRTATEMYQGLKCLAELPYKEAVERGERSPFVLFPNFNTDAYIASAKA